MSKSTNSSGKKENFQGSGSNHKLCAECFTKCAQWKLNATLTLNKNSTGLIFKGKSFFFKKLISPILQSFQIIDNISEISKNTIKSLEEKCLKEENNFPDENFDFSKLTFPLDNTNSHMNFIMTESNFSLSPNQENPILFFEFDLDSSGISKDHLKNFREINNEFVDKEIHFILNGTIHGKTIFKKDVRFFAEARRIIKSIQYRLDCYKNEFIEKQKSIQKSNPNFEIKNAKNNFFTRINSNQNIGLEFHKPNFENVEIYPTNFNSIVNSSIIIDKIYFEICLPKEVITNNSTFYNTDHETCLEKESKINKSQNITYSSNSYNSLYNQANTANFTEKYFNPSKSKSKQFEKQKENHLKGNFEINEKKKSSKTELLASYSNFTNLNSSNSFNINSYHQDYEKNSKQAPTSFEKFNTEKNSKSSLYNLNDRYQKKSKNREVSIYDSNKKKEIIIIKEEWKNYGNYKDRNYYNQEKPNYENYNNNFYNYKDNQQNNHQYAYNSGTTGRYYYDNQMNKYENNEKYSNRYDKSYDYDWHNRSLHRENSNKFYNYSNSHSNTPTKTEIYHVNSNSAFNTQGKSLNFSNQNSSASFSKSVNKINQIQNDSINEKTADCFLINQFNQLSPKSKLKNQTLQVLLTHYEGMCNFILFAKACSPYVHKSDTHLIDDIKILNFFKNFEKVSAFGLDINYIFENEVCPVNYSPTLSSMEIFLTDTMTYDKISKELIEKRNSSEAYKFYDYSTNHMNQSNNDNNYRKDTLMFEYNVTENLKILIFDKKIKLEFYENRPPHSRVILSSQLEEIFSCLKTFDLIDLNKIDKSSWFSVLWSPVRSNKSHFNSTTFLSYYQFGYTDLDLYYRGFNDFMEIPIVGILPIKLDDNVWLNKITKDNYKNLSYTSTLIDFKLALNDSVSNVHDFVFCNTDRTSNDYEFYLKAHM